MSAPERGFSDVNVLCLEITWERVPAGCDSSGLGWGEGGGGGAASLGDAADPRPAPKKKQVIVDSCDPCPCFSSPPDPHVLQVFTFC